MVRRINAFICTFNGIQLTFAITLFLSIIHRWRGSRITQLFWLTRRSDTHWSRLYFVIREFNLIQWEPVIRTSSGVEKHVLINVPIKGKINRGTYRNVSSEDVLITGMFLHPVFL